MKTKTQHTPGPWIVMGNQRHGHFDFVLPMAQEKDFQANARLIGAAPELLEAAKDAVKAMENDGYAWNHGVVELRAAIKKAEGK